VMLGMALCLTRVLEIALTYVLLSQAMKSNEKT